MKKIRHPSGRPAPKGTSRGRAWVGILASGALAVSGGLAAAPGEIAQSPVFLTTTGVPPNIFLLLDDSGSMDSEVLKFDGEDVDERVQFFGETADQRLRLCIGYNRLAYNPAVDYTPWLGEDRNKNAFQNQDPTKAQVHPYKAAEPQGNNCFTEYNPDRRTGGIVDDSKAACNLLEYPRRRGTDGAFYIEWKNGACDTDNPIFVSSLTAAEQVNFANWFSYYRRREFVLKRALSELISKSDARIGMATINRVGHIKPDLKVASPVLDLSDQDSKTTNAPILLDKLLGMEVGETTPLRIALKRVGEYFKGENPSALFGFSPPTPPDSAQGYSPILSEPLGGQCQQNYALVVSDGFWNGEDNPGLGNADGDNNSPYDGQSYADDFGATFDPKAEPIAMFGSTLADVAMHYYETDLIPGLPDEVAETKILNGTDDNPQQHLVTFTVAFGVFGDTTCDPEDREQSVEDQGWPQVCDDPDFAGTGTGWPQPDIGTSSTIDDMRHAAWNGRGLFLSARNPTELTDNLDLALGDIVARNATAAAAVAVNSTNLRSETLVFQAGFDSTLWSGTLSAFQLTEEGLGDKQWDAHGELLNSRSDRTIISFNGIQGVAFQFPDTDYCDDPKDDELSAEQVDDLMTDAPYDCAEDGGPPEDPKERTANQDFGRGLVAYLRGPFAVDEEKTTGFRQRGGLLADIIHSAPVFVGAPNPGVYPESIEPTSSYQAWADNSRADGGANDRREMVYVGTNGGTLQGFDAQTGFEVFAYYPKSVFSDADGEGINLLARKDYDHRYYVDNTPTIAEVFVEANGDAARWRTVLVGTLRGGGKGLFALDVSEPPDVKFASEAAAADNVLWEFTDPNLGFTFSRPTLAKLNNDRWAAIFGNGYNSDPDGDGTAKLYILYLDGNDKDRRNDDNGEILGKILETESGSVENNDCQNPASDCNGLATPAVVDLGGDGVADRVYVGDLKGNLWVFNLESDNPEDWGSAYLADGTDTPEPLFTAQVEDDNGDLQPQPITTQPAVTLHPTQGSTETQPNTLVFFGTGQLITASDIQTTGLQSFYGLWDGGAPISGNRGDLVPQIISQEPFNDEDFEVRTLTSNDVAYDAFDPEPVRGWYVDFREEIGGETGERVIVNPLLFGELVVYTTLIPSSSECSADGNSWLMVHDFITGGAPNFIAIDVDNNGTWDEEDVTEAGDFVAGVSTGDLFWQPTIVQSGVGTEGLVVGSKGTYGPDEDSVETWKIRGGSNLAIRSSWARFEFD